MTHTRHNWQIPLLELDKDPMGDNDEGSSEAAQSAQSETGTEPPLNDTPRSGGFLSRVFEALSPSDNAGSDTDNASDPAPSRSGHGMINLRRMRVEDVAIPKADIVAVPNSISLDELVEVFKESGMTRLPVFDGTLDTPLGFAHLKDLALLHGFNGDRGKDFVLEDMIRPLLFVPPSMTIGVLLTKMQTERRHMALVIDEYGGVDGLVTIEDLIEQVIGEIEDEHDVDEGQFFNLDAAGDGYLALAKTPLEDFETEIGQSLTDHEDVDAEEIDTLGGLVFMLAGRVPARGEVVVHPEGPEFEVIDADPRRIKRLRVRLPGLDEDA
ncbi:Hemolysin C [Pseudosulfitobacter sp. DSM 107133]|nr:Hemolysin C [Pseudosulfitobacter sp. DSM 107133]